MLCSRWLCTDTGAGDSCGLQRWWQHPGVGSGQSWWLWHVTPRPQNSVLGRAKHLFLLIWGNSSSVQGLEPAGPEAFAVGGPPLPLHHLSIPGPGAGCPHGLAEQCWDTVLWEGAPSASLIAASHGCPLELCSGERRHPPELALEDVLRLHRLLCFQLTLFLLGY